MTAFFRIRRFGGLRAARLTEVGELNPVKFVPAEQLFSEEGIIAGDVVNSSSMLILPAGLHINTLKETHPGLLELLKSHGITKVPVKRAPLITVEEFRELLGRVTPPVPLLNPLAARVAAHQMEVVYGNIPTGCERNPFAGPSREDPVGARTKKTPDHLVPGRGGGMG